MCRKHYSSDAGGSENNDLLRTATVTYTLQEFRALQLLWTKSEITDAISDVAHGVKKSFPAYKESQRKHYDEEEDEDEGKCEAGSSSAPPPQRDDDVDAGAQKSKKPKKQRP